MPPVKIHCTQLVESALHSALQPLLLPREKVARKRRMRGGPPPRQICLTISPAPPIPPESSKSFCSIRKRKRKPRHSATLRSQDTPYHSARSWSAAARGNRGATPLWRSVIPAAPEISSAAVKSKAVSPLRSATALHKKGGPQKRSAPRRVLPPQTNVRFLVTCGTVSGTYAVI